MALTCSHNLPCFFLRSLLWSVLQTGHCEPSELLKWNLKFIMQMICCQIWECTVTKMWVKISFWYLYVHRGSYFICIPAAEHTLNEFSVLLYFSLNYSLIFNSFGYQAIRYKFNSSTFLPFLLLSVTNCSIIVVYNPMFLNPGLNILL